MATSPFPHMDYQRDDFVDTLLAANERRLQGQDAAKGTPRVKYSPFPSTNNLHEKQFEKASVEQISRVATACSGESEGGGGGGGRQQQGLERGLKSRHAQMIALGGTIGTGLFVGSGQALSMGGPLFLLLSYLIISLFLFGVATGLTEIASYLPVAGCSVNYYAHRYVSPSLSFAMGWLYWYIFSITVPAEMTATGLVIEYWNVPINIGVWITVSGIVIVALNCLPVRFYGETEFWFASLKVMTIIGLIILTIILFFGGGPSHEPLWFTNWNKPAPVKEYLVTGDAGRLCGFVSAICFSIYAFAFAPELIVQTAGEMESPRYNLPIAGQRYMYRLLIFYIVGSFCIGILTSANNPDLLGGGHGSGSSPWALGIRAAGIKGLDSVVNAAILLSAWSAGNSYLYLASRALYSQAIAGNAPKVFARCSKSGVPYYAVMASAAWALLAYLNVAASTATVFNWFADLINTGGYQSWICCCIIYFRFRKATKVQGIRDLPYRSRFQPYAAWLSIFGLSVMLLINGYKVFLDGHWDTSTFLTCYIGIPIFFALYFGHMFTCGRSDKWWRSAVECDLHSGMEEVLALECPSRGDFKLPWYKSWKKIYE